MTARIIAGKAFAADVRQEVTQRVAGLARRTGVTPGLTVILAGENAASISYVRSKTQAAAEANINSQTIHLPAGAAQQEVLDLVESLNRDPSCHAILVQLPLPAHMDERTVINHIDPAKDVDGLHPLNMGRLLQGEPYLVPCTPAGVVEMLLRAGYDPHGKHVVVCGRSNLVGKPLAALLLAKGRGANATVTVCHTGTADLARYTRQADILVAAMGRAGAITASMIQPGAVVIDVGINRIDDPQTKTGYRLVGDVEFEAAREVAAAITPVPGGVGPMTVAMLLNNTLKAAQSQMGLPPE